MMNDPLNFVDEMLEGIVLAHPKQVKFSQEDSRGIVTAIPPEKNKVAIATGGGAGHLPVFLGYVGKGLADGASVGNVFTSPSADAMVNVAKEIDAGSGVLFLYGNYFGDKMNFDLAAEILEEDYGVTVKSVRISDDVASAPRNTWKKRRGVAGIFFAYKIVGACAASMASLDEVFRVAEKVSELTVTMGVGLSPCTLPGSNKPNFTIESNELEIGTGIHGEPGIEQMELKSADDVSEIVLNHLIEDLKLTSGEEVAILINGSGATPLEELYIINRNVHKILSNKNIKIYKSYVGEYATSLEMAGFSISFIKLDKELKTYLDAPAQSPFFSEEQMNENS